MKSAREAMHDIVKATIVRRGGERIPSCHYLGLSHTVLCDVGTAAIEARDEERVAETGRLNMLLGLASQAIIGLEARLRQPVYVAAGSTESLAAVAPGPGEGLTTTTRAPGTGETWEYTETATLSLRGRRIRLLERREFNDGWVVGDLHGSNDWESDEAFIDGTLRFIHAVVAAAPPVAPAPVPRPPALPLPWNGTGPEFNEAPAMGRPVAPAETPPPRPWPPCGDGMHCTCAPGAHERMRAAETPPLPCLCTKPGSVNSSDCESQGIRCFCLCHPATPPVAPLLTKEKP